MKEDMSRPYVRKVARKVELKSERIPRLRGNAQMRQRHA